MESVENKDISTKENIKANKSNILTIVLSIILVCMIVVLGLLLFNKFGEKKPTFKAYICGTTADGNILAFNETTKEPIYFKQLEEDVYYGDEIEYTLKKVSQENGKEVYTIKIVDVKTKGENYWPATSTIVSSYSYNYALENKDIIMEEECIISDSSIVANFENAISSKTPYYVRITDFSDGSNTIITDVFYDGNVFKVAEDSTINATNVTNEKIINYKQYNYFEKYEINGITIAYLTNTPNIMANAKDNGLFALMNSENYDGEPLDLYWLYYDMTEYLEEQKKDIIVVSDDNTLTFENGEVPCPQLLVTYLHYVNKNMIVSNEQGNNINQTNIISSSTNNDENNSVSTISLEETTDEIDARDIFIEEDGKKYSQTGLGTLEKDLSGFLILTNECNTITLEIEKPYEFNNASVKVYSYNDLGKDDAIPIEEYEFEDRSIDIELLENGLYIYEIIIESDNYHSRYVFYLQKQN